MRSDARRERQFFKIFLREDPQDPRPGAFLQKSGSRSNLGSRTRLENRRSSTKYYNEVTIARTAAVELAVTSRMIDRTSESVNSTRRCALPWVSIGIG